MSTVVLYGQDQISMDQYWLNYRKQFSEFKYIDNLDYGELEADLLSQGLFPTKKLYLFKNIFLRQIRLGKVTHKLESILNLLKREAESSDYLFMEEDPKKLKHYKQYFPKARYQQFKLTSSLFYFLDALKPGNFQQCYSHWEKAKNINAPELIFFMLKKRVRELILFSSGSLKGNYQNWQLSKLKSQLAGWQNKKLQSLYRSLYNLEKGIKTGNNPLSFENNIEVLLSIYL